MMLRWISLVPMETMGTKQRLVHFLREAVHLGKPGVLYLAVGSKEIGSNLPIFSISSLANTFTAAASIRPISFLLCWSAMRMASVRTASSADGSIGNRFLMIGSCDRGFAITFGLVAVLDQSFNGADQAIDQAHDWTFRSRQAR